MTLNTAPLNGGTTDGAFSVQGQGGDLNGPALVWSRAAQVVTVWSVRVRPPEDEAAVS